MNWPLWFFTVVLLVIVLIYCVIRLLTPRREPSEYEGSDRHMSMKFLLSDKEYFVQEIVQAARNAQREGKAAYAVPQRLIQRWISYGYSGQELWLELRDVEFKRYIVNLYDGVTIDDGGPYITIHFKDKK